MENLGNVISSDWTPWVNYNTTNSSGEFVVGQVFTSKAALQYVVKLYSIKAHQQYVVVASSKKLLVLRCEKFEECQCTWKLRAMVVKYISFFAINKYKGLHTCVNPYLNRDHQQLDSNLVADHIKVMIKAQFTLSVVAIQATIMEKFGYEISYEKAQLQSYLGTSISHMQNCHVSSWMFILVGLNPGFKMSRNIDDISSIFQVSVHSNIISVNDSRLREKIDKIG